MLYIDWSCDDECQIQGAVFEQYVWVIGIFIHCSLDRHKDNTIDRLAETFCLATSQIDRLDETFGLATGQQQQAYSCSLWTAAMCHIHKDIVIFHTRDTRNYA